MATLAKALHAVRYLPGSRLRHCDCCDRTSVILRLGPWSEYQRCVRCRANDRYELLGAYLRSRSRMLADMAVLELDPSSPLKPRLARARSYTSSHYSTDEPFGSVNVHGSRCEDITQLTFGPDSLDLIVSSEVLEHVPDLDAAFRESCRVLRPGGAHVFTVPPREITRPRACIAPDGRVEHLLPPEYHGDPLRSGGILTFWDIGPDAPQVFAASGLELRTVAGPNATGRVVWAAVKPGQHDFWDSDPPIA